MTWTCKCTTVNDDHWKMCDGCANDKPAELSEEERAALKAHNDGVRESGLSESFWTVDYFAADKERRAYLVAFWKAARAPLEAEVKTLRENFDRERFNLLQAMGETEMGHGWHWLVSTLRERVEEGRKSDVHIEELEAENGKLRVQLAQAQKPAAIDRKRALDAAYGAILSHVPIGEASVGEVAEAVVEVMLGKAAPAGLPEVGTPVEVETATEHFQRDVVDYVEQDPECPCKNEGPCFYAKNWVGHWHAGQEGKRWRRLPPAQTSTPRELPRVGEELWHHIYKLKVQVISASGDRFRVRGKNFIGEFEEELSMQDGTDRGRWKGKVWSRMRNGFVVTEETGSQEVAPAQTSREPVGRMYTVEGTTDVTQATRCTCGHRWAEHKPNEAACAMCRGRRGFEPAASPPGEVSTENYDGFMRYVSELFKMPVDSETDLEKRTREAVRADIRANIERAVKPLRDKVIELQNRVVELNDERDAALAEVERLRKAYKSRDEGRMVMSLVGLEREVERLKAVRTAWQAASGRIVEYLEPSEKCAMATPEETERVVRETVERLKVELVRAKEARRCPADGMSDERKLERFSLVSGDLYPTVEGEWVRYEDAFPVQPAPEKPSADREVTTENFDKLEGCGLQMFGGLYGQPLKPITCDVEFVRRVQAREALAADIRANVDRATAGLRLEASRANARADDYERLHQADAERIVYLESEVERLKVNLGDSNWARDKFLKERDEARSANREQRRAGVMDAVKWLDHKCACGAILLLEEALDRGEVLRDGDAAKQERAPEKTGRLPVSGCHIFARQEESCPWFLNSTYEDGTRAIPPRRIAVDVPGLLGGRCTVFPSLENEGVLWCWPQPGMM